MRDEEGETTFLRPDPWAHELEIPQDATQMEIWFRMSDAHGCTNWDSRFGFNYWFDVTPSPGNPPTIPAESVLHRSGARPSPEMINVFSERASKRRSGDSPHTMTVETRLFLQAWGPNRPPSPAAVWVDAHVFDEADNLIHSETCPLDYQEPAGEQGGFYVLDRPIYRGSSLVPAGSVGRSSDRAAQKLQYRLYWEADGQLFTDGLLHQHDLPQDAASH